MTDVVWSTIHKEPIEIYGFQYNPHSDPKIAMDPIYIVVRNKELDEGLFDEQIQKSHQLIRMLEIKLEFEPSRLKKVDHENGGDVWMFILDKKWIHTSALLSMLTLFMRVGCNYSGKGKLNAAIRSFKRYKPEDRDDYSESTRSNDANYLRQSHKLRCLILKQRLSIFAPKMEDNYPHSDVDSIHERWGIVGARNCNELKCIWNLDGIKTILQKKKTKKKVMKKIPIKKKVAVKKKVKVKK